MRSGLDLVNSPFSKGEFLKMFLVIAVFPVQYYLSSTLTYQRGRCCKEVFLSPSPLLAIVFNTTEGKHILGAKAVCFLDGVAGC